MIYLPCGTQILRIVILFSISLLPFLFCNLPELIFATGEKRNDFSSKKLTFVVFRKSVLINIPIISFLFEYQTRSEC